MSCFVIVGFRTVKNRIYTGVPFALLCGYKGTSPKDCSVTHLILVMARVTPIAQHCTQLQVLRQSYVHQLHISTTYTLAITGVATVVQCDFMSKISCAM